MAVKDEDGNVLRNEDGTQVGSVDVSLDAEAEAEDLSKLSKAELQDRATAAGYDTQGLLKADLIELLESEVNDGNDSVS